MGFDIQHMLHAAAGILPIMLRSLVAWFMWEGKTRKLLARIVIQAATGSSYQSEEHGSSRRDDQKVKTLGQD